MELLHYWRVIRKRLWLIALLVVMAISGTAFYTLSQKAQYESVTTLLLNPSVPSALVPYVQTQVAANLADNYTQLLHTRSFDDSVAKEVQFKVSEDGVARAITTRLDPNTLFFHITATMDTPEKAQLLSAAIIKVFLNSDASQQAAATDSTSVKSQIRQKLQDKLTVLDDQIKQTQDDIAAQQQQPPSQTRDDRLGQLRTDLIGLQSTETNVMLAIAQLPDPQNQPSTAMVIDQPLPGRAVSSRLLVNLGLALVVSLMLGIGVAFGLDYLDYTVRSPELLEESLGLNALGVIGVVGGGHRSAYGGSGRGGKRGSADRAASAGAGGAELKRISGSNLVTLEHPKAPESEGFRILRTNIQFSSPDKPIRSLVITSGGPGEGKSFVAANLAIVMAQAGKRVILVDTDLRRPSMHKLFRLPNTVGFTNLVLHEGMDVTDPLLTVPEVPNLRVITSGPLPPNPSELLNAQQTIQVMNQLAPVADLVIYDCPPTAAVTDAVILATRVDAVVLVIQAGVTRRDVVARVIKTLHTVGVQTIVPVLNRVKTQELQGYYYYYYHGYGTAITPTATTTTSNGYHTNGKIAPVDETAPVRSGSEDPDSPSRN